jgi:DNA-binding Lrp family transcriptional regulator
MSLCGGMIFMDDLDAKILTYIQSNFPIEEDPYSKIADDLKIDKEILIERIKYLYKNGYIIKIIPKFTESYYSNHSRVLVGMRVDRSSIMDVARVINNYDNISHNYERDHYFNIWFTIISDDMDKIKKIVDEISSNKGVRDYVVLPSKELLKLDTQFEVKI